MVEATLNWASIMGIILCFTSTIFFIIYFMENERINLINNAIILVSFFGGLILSFQGWRLDPIGQFSLTIIQVLQTFHMWYCCYSEIFLFRIYV